MPEATGSYEVTSTNDVPSRLPPGRLIGSKAATSRRGLEESDRAGERPRFNIPGLSDPPRCRRRRLREVVLSGQLVQVIGSLLVLAAFAAAQVGRLAQKSVGYLSLNLVGYGVLAVEAVLVRQWWFLLLEGVWAVVSALSMMEVLRARRARERPLQGRRSSLTH